MQGFGNGENSYQTKAKHWWRHSDSILPCERRCGGEILRNHAENSWEKREWARTRNIKFSSVPSKAFSHGEKRKNLRPKLSFCPKSLVKISLFSHSKWKLWFYNFPIEFQSLICSTFYLLGYKGHNSKWNSKNFRLTQAEISVEAQQQMMKFTVWNQEKKKFRDSRVKSSNNGKLDVTWKWNSIIVKYALHKTQYREVKWIEMLEKK